MKIVGIAVSLLVVCALPGWAEEQEASPVKQKTPWGFVIPQSSSSQQINLEVSEWPQDGRLELPAPLPSLTRTFLQGDSGRKPLPFEFNSEATRVVVLISPALRALRGQTIVVETAEKSGQLVDGRIVLSALDGKVSGKTARLETQPGNHRIGFWTDASDTVSWAYSASRPGTYSVELTYALVAGDGTEITIGTADTELTAKLAPTSSWYTYTTQSFGKLQITKPGEHTVTVRCVTKGGDAVMNLKAVTLRPTSEGNPVRQADDSSVTCHARDVTIQGIKVQYEPKPEKNTVGYWVIPTDRVFWNFTLVTPGKYTVEILQGCGKGAGGSEVDLSVGGETLRFTVEDTGHFQNFKPREIGTVQLDQPGEYTLLVAPVKKPGVAVMDLRQVRLVPVPVKN